MAFPLIRLIALIIYGILIVYQLALFKKNGHPGKMVFLIFLCALFFRTFVELGYHLSSSFLQAVVWWHFDFIRPVLHAIWLHYIFLYISALQKRELSGKENKTIIFGYFSSGVFLLFEFFTNWISREPAVSGVGFSHRMNVGSAASVFYSVWILLIIVYSIYLLLQTTVNFSGNKKPLKIKLIVLLVLVVFSFVFDLVLPLLQIQKIEIVNVALVGIALLLSVQQFPVNPGKKVKTAEEVPDS